MVRCIKYQFFKIPAFRIGRAFIFFFLLWSCVPDPLEVQNIPRVSPQIVVSTQMVSDQALIVWLTQTFGALDASEDSDPEELLKQLAVNDAVVSISGPSGTDTLKLSKHGFYGGSNLTFEAGKTYELHINSETLGTVSATTSMQAPVVFEELETSLFYDIYDDTLVQVNYQFRDPPERNRYMLNVQKLNKEEFEQHVFNPRAHTLLLEDDDFNDLLYENQLSFPVRGYAPGDTVAVSLSNISEAYYRFLKMRIDSRIGFLEFLSEPVNYPTNVTGGRGFFNLHLPDIRLFILQEPEQ